MFYLLLIFSAAIILLCAFYLVKKFKRFSIIERCGEKHRFLSWILALLPLLAICGFAVINVTAVFVVMLHLALGFALCDLVSFIIYKVSKRKISFNARGIAAVLIAAAYLAAGWYSAHHIVKTEYTFYTDKPMTTNNLRIALIADSHIGVTLDGEAFENQLTRIAKENPNILVIAGDFVDDDSSKEDMIRACNALGNLKTSYGVYFVYGNHDNGYMRYRDFTGQDLAYYLEKNNVNILKDSACSINSYFNIIGRLDRSSPSRKSAGELMAQYGDGSYTIMLDHQPNDYAAEAQAGVDLVLSGHTHGGHIFPAGIIGLLFGANDKVYGSETRENTTFVVTSGISGWAIPFKTAAKSEYVIIDIKNK